MKFSKKIYIGVLISTLMCFVLAIHFFPPTKRVITKFEEKSTLVLSDYSQIVVNKATFDLFTVGSVYLDYELIFIVALVILIYLQLIYLLYFYPK